MIDMNKKLLKYMTSAENEALKRLEEKGAPAFQIEGYISALGLEYRIPLDFSAVINSEEKNLKESEMTECNGLDTHEHRMEIIYAISSELDSIERYHDLMKIAIQDAKISLDKLNTYLYQKIENEEKTFISRQEIIKLFNKLNLGENNGKSSPT